MLNSSNSSYRQLLRTFCRHPKGCTVGLNRQNIGRKCGLMKQLIIDYRFEEVRCRPLLPPLVSLPPSLR